MEQENIGSHKMYIDYVNPKLPLVEQLYMAKDVLEHLKAEIVLQEMLVASLQKEYDEQRLCGSTFKG